MHVASESRDLVVDKTAAAVLGEVRVVLVAGAPGFGKTSVLGSAARRVADQTGCKVLWINGAIVGSEDHLARIIVEASPPEDERDGQERSKRRLEGLILGLADSGDAPYLLAVDDVDALFFKRERLARLFGLALSSGERLMLLGSCHPSVCRRLVHRSPLGDELGGKITTVQIDLFGEKEAHRLVGRRVQGLPSEARSLIVEEAGGHPAALVFLARLARLYVGDSSPWTCVQAEFLDRAGELAGSVYAESWALLGPQQRALLWHLGTAPKPLSAGALAEAIALRPSQVSAQIRRLVDEGLVSAAARRAQFTVAPLLARWIAVRAARGRQLNRDLEGVEDGARPAPMTETGD